MNALRRARGRLGTPKVLDDLVDRHHLVRAEQEEGEESALLMPAELEALTLAAIGDVNGLLGVITGGTATNWPGGGYDPETHVLYVYSQSAVASLGLAFLMWRRSETPASPSSGRGPG